MRICSTLLTASFPGLCKKGFLRPLQHFWRGLPTHCCNEAMSTASLPCGSISSFGALVVAQLRKICKFYNFFFDIGTCASQRPFHRSVRSSALRLPSTCPSAQAGAGRTYIHKLPMDRHGWLSLTTGCIIAMPRCGPVEVILAR